MGGSIELPAGFFPRLSYCFRLANRFNIETEELPDFFIHRRIASVAVALMGALDMPWLFTPNRVTFVSLIFGVASAYCVLLGARNDDVSYLGLAGVLELLSIGADCCDGQLARLQGSGTLVGRVLDGLVDMCVALSHGFVWTYCMVFYYHTISPVVGFIFLTVAIVTFQQQAMMYDRIKNLYCLKTSPKKDKVVGLEESEEIDQGIQESWEKGRYCDYAMLVWYKQQYMAVQNSVAKKSVDSVLKEKKELSPEEYREKWKSTMRLISWCGTGTHAFLFYALLFAAYFTGNPHILVYWFALNNIVLTAIWLECLMNRVGEM